MLISDPTIQLIQDSQKTWSSIEKCHVSFILFVIYYGVKNYHVYFISELLYRFHIEFQKLKLNDSSSTNSENCKFSKFNEQKCTK